MILVRVTEFTRRRNPVNASRRAPSWSRYLIAVSIAAIGLAVVGPTAANAIVANPPPKLSADSTSEPGGEFEDSEFGYRGFVRDGATPVEGAEVRVLDEGTVLGEDVTDGDGAWGVIRVPEAGTYTLEVDVSELDISFGSGEVFSAEVELPAALKVLNRVVLMQETSRAVTSTGDQFLQRAVAGLNLGLLLALAAIGLSVLFGTTKIMNFAHAENVTFGGIIGFVFANLLGLPLLLAIVLAALAGALFGLAQDAGLWRPLRRKGVGLVPLMIVSIGFGLALRSVYQFFFGNASRPVSDESWGEPLRLGPVILPVMNLATMVISAVVLVGVGLWITYGRLGKATRAIANNPSLAAASGIDVDRVVRFVWVLSGGLAALAGVLLGVFNQVDANMGFNALLLMFSAIILGGLGSAFGALVGALFIGLFTEILVLWIPADMKYVGALAALILVLLVRPQGIFGRRERIG